MSIQNDNYMLQSMNEIQSNILFIFKSHSQSQVLSQTKKEKKK